MNTTNHKLSTPITAIRRPEKENLEKVREDREQKYYRQIHFFGSWLLCASRNSLPFLAWLALLCVLLYDIFLWIFDSSSSWTTYRFYLYLNLYITSCSVCQTAPSVSKPLFPHFLFKDPRLWPLPESWFHSYFTTSHLLNSQDLESNHYASSSHRPH